MRRRTFGVLALLSILATLPASAAPIADAEYRRLNTALVDGFVLPLYRDLATAANRFATAIEALCAVPAPARLDRAREAYHIVMDAWMAVQHIRFGPVELFMRGYRLYFWPESRGRVDDAVRQVLKEMDDTGLSAEGIARASVAVQGLPAAEQLLFVGAVRLSAPETAATPCRLLRAIGGNLAEIAKGLSADWQGGTEPFRAVIAHPGPDNIYFETHRDATLAFFKSLHNGLQFIADLRLKPVLGATIRQAQPKLAESVASGRSVRNVVVSLKGLQAMYLGKDGEGFTAVVQTRPGGAELDALMRKAFNMTIDSAEAIMEPLSAAVADAERRRAVETLHARVLALKQIVRTSLADALDVAVGFNALDGD